MRKVILFIACSLDGFIARDDGAVDWLFADQDYGYSEFYNSVDVVLMGRKSFQQILTFGEYLYADKQTLVFSSQKFAALPAGVQVTARSPQELLRELKQEAGKHLWLLGGGELIQTFVEDDLIDEFVISIHPILLGSGIPLFAPGFAGISLRLTQQQSFSSGLVQLHYERQAAD